MRPNIRLWITGFIIVLLTQVFSFAQEPMTSSAVISVEQKDKISLDIRGMDIVDVLKMLAAKNNLNLVIDKSVLGRVTVFLKDVSPKQALEVILASNGLAYDQEGDIGRIMTTQDYEQLHGVKYRDPREMRHVALKYGRPQDIIPVLNQMKSGTGMIVPDEGASALILFDTNLKNNAMAKMIEDMDAPVRTEVFDLSYARCDKIAELLQGELTRGTGVIKTDSRTNKLIVTDYAPKLKRIKEIVAKLDERTKEVQIDAKIIQISLDDKTSLGVDWEYVLNKKFDVRSMFGQVITTTGNKWMIGTAVPADHNDYKAVLEALNTLGHAKILSSPRLTVTNNEEARILVGSKQVYVTTSAVQGQTTTQTAEAVNFVDVGVKLFVTPVISSDGFISMKVRPEVSSATQTYKTSTGNTIPIVETSEAQTSILVKDGATIIIAGLMKDEKTKNVNKIPLIGNIPFLGALFRNSIDETKKTELVIFMTCKILKFDEPSGEKS